MFQCHFVPPHHYVDKKNSYVFFQLFELMMENLVLLYIFQYFFLLQKYCGVFSTLWKSTLLTCFEMSTKRFQVSFSAFLHFVREGCVFRLRSVCLKIKEKKSLLVEISQSVSEWSEIINKEEKSVFFIILSVFLFDC